jgi:hypothetical protein
MNSDLEYLYLDVKFNDQCTKMTVNFGIFMYIDKLGLKGGSLEGEDAFKFLKSTIHGSQPDLINYFWMFSPDAAYNDLNIDLTVVIPPITDVKFKHNKFDRKRSALKSAMMSIPCVKKLKINPTQSDLADALKVFRSKTSGLPPDQKKTFDEMQQIEQLLLANPNDKMEERIKKVLEEYATYNLK